MSDPEEEAIWIHLRDRSHKRRRPGRPPAAERQLDQVMVAKLGSCPRSFDG